MTNDSQANQEADAPVDAPSSGQVSDGLEAEVAKVRDELLRALAEIENTRRRAERQAADARTYAIDRFANDLLPVADTLSRALAAVSQQARDTADESTRTLIAGIELTERSLLEVFGRHGLRRVGAKGEPFDPNRHQAVAQQPSDQPANTVLEVLQPGYVLSDRTVRPAMVLLSAGPAAGAPAANVDIKV